MKKTFLLLCLLSSLSTCFSQKKEGYQQDLEIYKEIIEASHTGMYLYTPKATFDQLFEDAFKAIATNKVHSDRQFFLLLAHIHTKINCGHSSVYPSESVFADITEKEKAFFPLKVKFIKDTLVVSKANGKLKRGTQITKINNNTISQIKDAAFNIISSDGFNTTFKYRQLEEDFSNFYFALFGPNETYDIEYIPYQSKETLKTTLQGVSMKAVEASPETIADHTPTAFSIIDANTALLTVNTFSTGSGKGQKKFFKFLKKTFRELQEKNIRNLILDIRENTGGDDGNDMELASYLINKPFKENKFRKLNPTSMPLYAEYLHPIWRNMMDFSQKASSDEIKKKFKEMVAKEFYKGKDGMFYLKENLVIRRTPKPELFTGNTYILISGKVFSGGALFSALVRDKSDAVFVGEETGGGYYRHTGSIPLFYTLPNALIPFSMFTVINEQDVDQQLFPQGSGIVPHYEVYPTIKDFVDGKDVVLEFAKDRIKKLNKA